MLIRFKRLRPHAQAPTRAHPGDAGADLYVALPPGKASVRIPAGGRRAIPTGLAVAIPHGFVGRVRHRSGHFLRAGVLITGEIDAGYRGELYVLALNATHEVVVIPDGARIAQLIVSSVALEDYVEVDELDATARGAGGFGSTGP